VVASSDDLTLLFREAPTPCRIHMGSRPLAIASLRHQQRAVACPFLRFLDDANPVFQMQVLTKLSTTGRGVFSRASTECRDAVIASNLPHASASSQLPFMIEDLVESVELLKWAKSNGCPVLDKRTFALAAEIGSGNMQVIRFLKKHGCPWWEVQELSRHDTAWLPKINPNE